MLCLTAIVITVLAARLRGRLAWTDAAFPLLLLGPIHWETLTLTPFLGAKILPLLLVMLLAFIWSVRSAVVQAVGVSVLGALALFTGYGFCVAPVIIGLALLLWLRSSNINARAERAQAAVILITICAAVMIFLHQYHWSTGTANWRFPVSNWWDYPRFCALMFTNLLGWRALSLASVFTGAVLLSLVVVAFVGAAILIWRRRATARVRVVWILTGTSLVYVALTAIGRLPTSLEAAFMWRYLTLTLPAICGLALGAEGWASSRSGKLRVGVAVGWLVVAGVVWSNFTPEIYAATVAKGKRRWVASYLQTRDLKAANAVADFWIYFPDPTSSVIEERLRWLEERRLSFFRSAPEPR